MTFSACDVEEELPEVSEIPCCMVLEAVRAAARSSLGDAGPFLGNLRKIEAAALEHVRAALKGRSA